ncbi:MAG: hypothetical protein Q7N50_11050 [Armatimonadota bacterium]|nr:hypothetical protein [Armatimonadota bacterium]
MKLSRDAWIVIVLFALFSTGSFVILRGARQPDISTNHTSYSVQSSGTKALFILLNRLGYRAERLRISPEIDQLHARALVIIGPKKNYPDLSPDSPLDKWMRAGGSILLFMNEANPDLDIGVKATEPVRNRGIQQVKVTPAYAGGVSHLYLRSRSRLQYFDSDMRSVARDSHGVIAVEASVGRGRLVVLSDPWIASNSAIGKSDNAVFITNLVSARNRRGEIVLFDEYSQGYGIPKSKLGALPRPLLFAIVQFAIIVLLAVYTAGRRFGSVRQQPDKASRRPAHEYVRAMGRLYKRAHARPATIGILLESFRNDICRRLGIPIDSDLNDVVQAVESFSGIDSGRIRSVLAQSEKVDRMSDSELLEIARELRQFRKELGIDR